MGAMESSAAHPDDCQILIIDDDVDTRESLQEILAAHGMHARVAENGADGLHQLRAGLRPSVILLDLMMPDKNGFQFRVEQVMDPELAKIPVVLYSGNPEAYEEGKVFGPVACLTKPINIGELLQVLKAYC